MERRFREALHHSFRPTSVGCTNVKNAGRIEPLLLQFDQPIEAKFVKRVSLRLVGVLVGVSHAVFSDVEAATVWLRILIDQDRTSTRHRQSTAQFSRAPALRNLTKRILANQYRRPSVDRPPFHRHGRHRHWGSLPFS